MAIVRVEFFGMARRYAGCESLELDATTTGDVLQQLVTACPPLDGTCIRDGELAAGWLLNLDGRQFTRSLNEPLQAGASVLLLSSDVGG